MPNKKKRASAPTQTSSRFNEDWLSLLIAFTIFLLSAIGILGQNGIHITF